MKRNRWVVGRMGGRMIALPLLLAAYPAIWLSAQCPDGSSPPCVRPTSHVPAPNSVAVLYFESRDTADAYLADGLSEDIATLLGGVSSVAVKPPGIVRRAQHATPGNFPAISRALGVRYLVDGTVRRAGGRLRVSARLVAGGTAVAAWGEIFDRAPEELLALPSVIAREVATRVGGAIAPAESTSLTMLRTRNPAANEHYFRGNFLVALRSPEALSRALAEYAEAERLDSGGRPVPRWLAATMPSPTPRPHIPTAEQRRGAVLR